MLKFRPILSVLSLSVSVLTTSLPAEAETVCKVSDPTGTPLNVRAEPNGRIINTLTNGTEVYVDQIVNDDRGRPWAKVSGYYQGEYITWGWVFREFISCYER